MADGTPCRQNLGARDMCIAGKSSRIKVKNSLFANTFGPDLMIKHEFSSNNDCNSQVSATKWVATG